MERSMKKDTKTELNYQAPMYLQLREIIRTKIEDEEYGQGQAIPSENALAKQYKKLLELDGVDLEFMDEALDAIAEEALRRNTGARGLRAIIEDVMLEVMYEVPSRIDITKVLVTREVIAKKEKPLLVTVDARRKVN